MAQAEKWQRYRKLCAQCGKPFACYDRRQPTCSPRCAMAHRAPEWRRRFIEKGIEARRRKGYTRLVRLLREMGLTDAQVAVVHHEWRRRYVAGYKAGSDRGYRRGWSAACGEEAPSRSDRRKADTAA